VFSFSFLSVFNWTTGTHTATEVSTKEEYDNCTKMGMILAFAGVKVTFNENGTHYFLCSEGTHCEQGQKMIIKIGVLQLHLLPRPPPYLLFSSPP
jgi:hypothetical protein